MFTVTLAGGASGYPALSQDASSEMKEKLEDNGIRFCVILAQARRKVFAIGAANSGTGDQKRG